MNWRNTWRIIRDPLHVKGRSNEEEASPQAISKANACKEAEQGQEALTRIEQEMVRMMDAFSKDIASHHFFIGTSIWHWAIDWQTNRHDIDKLDTEITDEGMARMGELLASQLDEVLQRGL